MAAEEKPPEEKHKEKAKQEGERKRWEDMEPKDRSLQAAVAVIHRSVFDPEWWRSIPDRVGLADRIPGLKLSQLKSAGFGHVRDALREVENRKGKLRVLFRPPQTPLEEKRAKASRKAFSRTRR